MYPHRSSLVIIAFRLAAVAFAVSVQPDAIRFVPAIANFDVSKIPPFPTCATHVAQPTSRRTIRLHLRHISHTNAIIMTKNLSVSSQSTRSLSLKDPDVHTATWSYFAISVLPVAGADVFFVFVEGDDVRGVTFGLGEALVAVEGELHAHHGAFGAGGWAEEVEISVVHFIVEEVDGVYYSVDGG